MAPIALAPRLRRARNLLTTTSSHIHNNLHPLAKREKLSKSNIITAAVFIVILLSTILFFGIFLPRWTRKKKLEERQQALRETLTAEERAASGRSRGAAAAAAAAASTAGRSSGAGGQRQGGQGQGGGGEAIPMDDMAVPDGDGGWVEPPPPYVADPKPAYHP
ncbi:hypothetical protein B0H65DRAFT_1550 [Neurospora tetraspora]|uniref:Uncharacterized protein n=1 Tax=Neurospora tetraspora TaxID=94610 RepID=A0AAE0MWK6_9PEZI|nr:hypothetical protein B0H65DRAFT_1550 [Neurospora tetraspora]